MVLAAAGLLQPRHDRFPPQQLARARAAQPGGSAWLNDHWSTTIGQQRRRQVRHSRREQTCSSASARSRRGTPRRYPGPNDQSSETGWRAGRKATPQLSGSACGGVAATSPTDPSDRSPAGSGLRVASGNGARSPMAAGRSGRAAAPACGGQDGTRGGWRGPAAGANVLGQSLGPYRPRRSSIASVFWRWSRCSSRHCDRASCSCVCRSRNAEIVCGDLLG